MPSQCFLKTLFPVAKQLKHILGWSIYNPVILLTFLCLKSSKWVWFIWHKNNLQVYLTSICQLRHYEVDMCDPAMLVLSLAGKLQNRVIRLRKTAVEEIHIWFGSVLYVMDLILWSVVSLLAAYYFLIFHLKFRINCELF